jgi:predicted dehydrogenase
MAPLKLGFIGVGYIAERAHFPALLPLRDAGEIVFQAFCDTNEETLRAAGEKYGVERLYTDHHPMLEREPLDALYLLIPPTFHTDAELIAAERGIALFVEKPQTLDLEQALRFEAAIRRSGIVSQVGFMTRYYPAAERVREILAERTPRHAGVQFLYSGDPVRYWTSRWELCGGSFVENSIHMVDFVRSLFGDVALASAFYLERKPGEERGPMHLPHAYLVNYRFQNGLLAHFTTSRCLTSGGGGRRDALLVSDGSLIEWSSGRIVENGSVLWEGEPGDPFTLQARAFLQAVRDQDPEAVRSPYSGALNSLAAVLAANESAARDGEPVRVRIVERE